MKADDGGAPAARAAASGATILSARAIATVSGRGRGSLAGLEGGLIKAGDDGADELGALATLSALASSAALAASAAITGEISIEVGLINDDAIALREHQGEGGAAGLTALPWLTAAAAEAT